MTQFRGQAFEVLDINIEWALDVCSLTLAGGILLWLSTQLVLRGGVSHWQQ